MESRRAVLSIRQPWAWAIVNGWKPVENRTWYSNYRGPLLIHAGKREERGDISYVLTLISQQTGVALEALTERYQKEAQLGAVVGECSMVWCANSQMEAVQRAGVDQQCNVPRWWQGPYGFVLNRATEWDYPVPLRGRLGIWFVDAGKL